MKTKLYLFGALACCSIYANAARCVYISSADELVNFRNALNSGTVKVPMYVEETGKTSNYLAMYADKVVLTEDIDLKDVCNSSIGSWTPIGTWNIDKEIGTPFSAEFDGNNHSISNLYISSSGLNPIAQGLFGYVTGTIKNVVLKGSIETGQYVGALVGVLKDGTINNCTNYCNVKASGYRVGGFCGESTTKSTISNCSNFGSIEGNSNIGGIVGITCPSLTYCANYGTIKGTSYVGGLVGRSGNVVLSNCFNYADVIGGYPISGTFLNSESVVFYNSESQNSGSFNYEKAYPKSAFASGEVAYLLNNGSDVWKQNIGVDPYPVLEGKTVYKHELEDGVVYSNSNELDVIYYGDGSSKEVIQTTDFTPTDNSFLVTKNENIGGYNVVYDNGDGDYSCNEFHLVDGQSFSSPIAFDVKKLTYDRPATASSIVTVVLPARILTDHLKGSKYVFSKFDGANVYFSSFEEDSMQANRPYVVKPEDCETEILEDGTYGAVVEPTRSMAEIEYNGLSNFGVYEQSSFSSDGHYSYIIFSSGKLKKYTKINLSPFRAGFRLDLDASNVSSTLGLVFDNDLSGVVLVENDQFVTGKVNVFDVQGRLVRANAEATTCFEGLKKGIYIVNGTKYKLEPETKTQTTLKRASASNGFAE